MLKSVLYAVSALTAAPASAKSAGQTLQHLSVWQIMPPTNGPCRDPGVTHTALTNTAATPAMRSHLRQIGAEHFSFIPLFRPAVLFLICRAPEFQSSRLTLGAVHS